MILVREKDVLKQTVHYLIRRREEAPPAIIPPRENLALGGLPAQSLEIQHRQRPSTYSGLLAFWKLEVGLRPSASLHSAHNSKAENSKLLQSAKKEK
jgi:hypothetical protein